MLSDQAVGSRKVLVELSVIPLSSNGQVSDQVAQVLAGVEKTGLSCERTNSGTCLEGEWRDISALIYECYEQIQEQSSQGFLKVSIR
jgi:uncharacterized protein YqgV (UPF0045/DUF77 family)